MSSLSPFVEGQGLTAVVTHMLENWAQVPAGCQSLPGQVLQPVPSILLLPSAQAADEPSLNQLQEPHTMLWLLGITSLKSILAAAQD